MTTMTIPAEYADDFRAAIVGELAQTIEHVQTERKRFEERTWRRDPLADVSEADLSGAMRLVARDARLLAQIGHEGIADLQVDIDDEGTLAHVFETMARDVVGPRLTEALTVGPMEPEWTRELTPLIGRLSWAIDRAAECHAVRTHREG